jgi:hypothetical protein
MKVNNSSGRGVILVQRVTRRKLVSWRGLSIL